MEDRTPRLLAPRIETDPAVLGGKPTITGTRLSVELILELLACGDSFDDLLDAYPFLTREDISAALEYAAKLSSHPTDIHEQAAS